MSSKSALLLRLNNHPHEFTEYMTIFQACLYVKKYIPRFCYHMALKIAGNCRMCLIEEKSSLKPLASCAITITNGMGIQTDTEMVKKAREGVLEYLLINHPLDCPICDQGGECDSQDQTMVFGADRGRFYESKRSTPNKNVGFLIKTFLNRCIHCARRTRFLADLTGTADLQLLGRGLKTEIGSYTDKFITTEVSGNIADLCPVGALTSKPYAFKARPWELVPAYTFDIMDALGSNIEVNYRGTEIMRILPRINKAVNGEWVTDKTRFFYDAIMLQRVSEPYIYSEQGFDTISWLTSFEFSKNSFISYAEYGGIDTVSVGVGSFLDLETITSIKNLCSIYGLCNSTKNIVGSFKNNDLRSSYIFKLEQLEPEFLKTRNLILVNVNLRYESPLLNIQIRLGQQEHDQLEVFIVGFLSNTNFNFIHLGTHASRLAIGGFFEKNVDTVVILGAQNEITGYDFSIFNQTNYVWTRISQLSYLEIMSVLGADKAVSLFGINVGVLRPELPSLSILNLVSVNFLHHMIDNYLPAATNGVFWPTKFYLEKVSSFIGNVGHFFSTVINIFGFNIRGTKEEHKILRAFDELLETRLPQITFDNINFARIGINEKPVPLGLNFKSGIHSFDRVPTRSLINNYYQTNELSEVSPVLGLCAKKYGVMNDYLWSSPVLNKC